MPLLEEVAGTHCEDFTPVTGIVTQDPTTLYWTGKVYAQTMCQEMNATGYATEGKVYEGCVLVRWDTTGTTYTILEVIYRFKTEINQKNRRIGSSDCFTEIPTIS